jgi:hypothetical protein
LGDHVPYFGVISERGRGSFSDYHEAALQHYRAEKKIDLPYTARVAELARTAGAISTVWLYRGPVDKATTTAPQPGPHAREAGAWDSLDVKAAANWRRVIPGKSLQAAVDAAAAEGGVVLLEPGVHTLSSPLLLRSGVTIVGHGRQSVLHLATEQIDFCLMQAQPRMEKLILRNFLVEGAQTTDWPHDPNQAKRERGFQTARQRGGILLRGDREGDIRDVTLDHITIRNCTLSGISICGAAGVTISDCDVSANGGTGAPGPFQHHNILMNHVQDCMIIGSRLDDSMGGSGFSVLNSARVNVRQSEACRNRQYGFAFQNCIDASLEESLVEANEEDGFQATSDWRPSKLLAQKVVQRLNGK